MNCMSQMLITGNLIMEKMSTALSTVFLGYIAAFVGFLYPDYFYTIAIAIILTGVVPIDLYPRSMLVISFIILCALSLL